VGLLQAVTGAGSDVILLHFLSYQLDGEGGSGLEQWWRPDRLAARRENKKVKLLQVLAHVRLMQKRFDVLLVEGAGGLVQDPGPGIAPTLLLLFYADVLCLCSDKAPYLIALHALRLQVPHVVMVVFGANRA